MCEFLSSQPTSSNLESQRQQCYSSTTSLASPSKNEKPPIHPTPLIETASKVHITRVKPRDPPSPLPRQQRQLHTLSDIPPTSLRAQEPLQKLSFGTTPVDGVQDFSFNAIPLGQKALPSFSFSDIPIPVMDRRIELFSQPVPPLAIAPSQPSFGKQAPLQGPRDATFGIYSDRVRREDEYEDVAHQWNAQSINGTERKPHKGTRKTMRKAFARCCHKLGNLADASGAELDLNSTSPSQAQRQTKYSSSIFGQGTVSSRPQSTVLGPVVAPTFTSPVVNNQEALIYPTRGKGSIRRRISHVGEKLGLRKGQGVIAVAPQHRIDDKISDCGSCTHLERVALLPPSGARDTERDQFGSQSEVSTWRDSSSLSYRKRGRKRSIVLYDEQERHDSQDAQAMRGVYRERVDGVRVKRIRRV